MQHVENTHERRRLRWRRRGPLELLRRGGQRESQRSPEFSRPWRNENEVKAEAAAFFFFFAILAHIIFTDEIVK